MGVKWIIGRAGTGKTYHCAHEITAHLRDTTEGPFGAPLWWIVPNQATFNTERTLLSHAGVKGFFRVSIFSLRRLVELLAKDTGVSMHREMDDMTRWVLLSRLVHNETEYLTILKETAHHPGFIKLLDTTLGELLDNGYTPGTLRELADSWQGEQRESEQKFRDLAHLLHAWINVTGTTHLSPDQATRQVIKNIAGWEKIRTTNIWVDAVYALNRLEIELLGQLARHAQSLTITLLADPEIWNQPEAHQNVGPFRKTVRLFGQLTEHFDRLGVPVSEPMLLRSQPPHRYRKAPHLAVLEDQLIPVAARGNEVPTGPASVQIWQAATPLDEVRAVAHDILRRIRADHTLRFRDIGLVLPDLDAYESHISRVFKELQIPSFLDKRRPIHQHPLVEFVRYALDYQRSGQQAEHLLNWMKTGLLGFDDAQISTFTKACRAFAVRKLEFVLAPDGTSLTVPVLEALEALTLEDQRIRQQRDNFRALCQLLCTRLAGWFKTLQAMDHQAGSLTLALLGLMQQCATQAVIARWCNEAISAQRHEEAQLHQAAWTQIMELLQRIQRLEQADRLNLNATEFADVLMHTLESMTLGIIPPNRDQVVVSSMTRSRHPNLRVVYLPGATAADYPQRAGNQHLLTDDERAWCNQDETRMPLTLTGKEHILEGQLYDYIAVTRGSESLIVSYPKSDGGGKALQRSRYVDRISRLLKLEPVVLKPMQAPWADILDHRGLMAAALPLCGRVDPAAQTICRSITDYFQSHDTWAQAWAYLQKAREQTSNPVTQTCLRETLGNHPTLSITGIETFAQCHMRFWLKYGMKLQENQELEYNAFEQGKFYHLALENLLTLAPTKGWYERGITQEEINELITLTRNSERMALLEKRLPTQPAQLMAACKNLHIAAGRVLAALCHGQMTPKAFELKFGGHSTSEHPDLVVTTKPVVTTSGQRVYLEGTIDRIDVSPQGDVLVYDYKTGTTEIDPVKHRAGIQLQLPFYMGVVADGLQLREQDQISVAGGFYGKLKYQRSKEADATVYTGIIDPARKDLIMDEQAEAEKVYNFKCKLDLPDYVASTRGILLDLLNTLFKTEVTPNPYQYDKHRACDYCPYSYACTFDVRVENFRNIKSSASDTLPI
jgi:ATP-dependent helicase/nuclease subunit B